jgi:hypothetical protein
MDKEGSFKNKDVKQTITRETTGKSGKTRNTYRQKKFHSKCRINKGLIKREAQ